MKNFWLDYLSINVYPYFRKLFLLIFLTSTINCNNTTQIKENPAPVIEKRGDAVQLIVDGKPFLALAGELHNSSSSSREYMKDIWPKLQKSGMNTVLAVVEWALIEPEEGKFDFSLVDGLLQDARKHDLRLALLWFGAWKNGQSHYVPEWVKKDYKRFPRVKTQNGKSLEILSPFSKATTEADAIAFAAMMRHLKEIDSEKRTVVMVQVQNEVGVLGATRDFSTMAEEAFNTRIPEDLILYLSENRENLLHDIPMFVNAWIVQPEDKKSGDYPSGGPQAHVLDVWRAGAPHVDLFCPDIYLPNFAEICELYTRNNNTLFIPESRAGDQGVGQLFYAIGKYKAIGYSPFGFESRVKDFENGPIPKAYKLLSDMAPVILDAQSKSKITGVLLKKDINTEEQLEIGGYTLTVQLLKKRRSTSIPDQGYGIIINSDDNEFVVTGKDIQITFSPNTEGPAIAAIARVDEGQFIDGEWIARRRLNGDAIMIDYDLAEKANENKTGTGIKFTGEDRIIQRAKLYRYE